MERRDELDAEAGLHSEQRLESVATLAAGIAHDLMSSLASISMSLELLGPKLGPEDAWLADSLSAALLRTKVGVRQVSWLAAAKTGGPVLFDPLHLVKESRSLLSQAFPGVRVSADYPAEVGLVRGEPALLRRLLLGLCTEACTRLPERGTLNLRASRAGQGAGEGLPGMRARFEIESRATGGEPLRAAGAAAWRDRPPMPALLAAFAAQGGTVDGGGEAEDGFGVRIEVPVEATPEGG